MKKLLKYFSFALISFQLFFSCSKPIEADLVITNVNIIDVKTGDVHSNMDVIVNGETITSIIEHKNNTNYKSANVIDASEKFLIPGLWDMHIHTHWKPEEFFPLLVANGITGIREMWSDLDVINLIKENIKQGLIIGPRILAAGKIVNGTYEVRGGRVTTVLAKTPEEGRQIVKDQKANGANFIKIYDQLDRDVYFAIADECKKQGISFVGHLPYQITIEEALESGQRSFEHFYGMTEFPVKEHEWLNSVIKGEVAVDSLNPKTSAIYEKIDLSYDNSLIPEFVNLLAKYDTYICPTSIVTKGDLQALDPDFETDDRKYYIHENLLKSWIIPESILRSEEEMKFRKWLSEWYNRTLPLIKAMQDGGVKLLAGTDTPAGAYGYPGFAIHDECKYL